MYPKQSRRLLYLKVNKSTQMLSADPDAVAQPVTVEKKRVLSNVPLIYAEDETYEEKEETPVDARKAKAKGDVNLLILSKERVDLDDDEIEEKKE
ncbi:hypothetical protein TNCV_4474461 [Trichonephila clavipes]|nr:hypothetical protein TNCV_4474461 [Trichonephila clavipes]